MVVMVLEVLEVLEVSDISEKKKIKKFSGKNHARRMKTVRGVQKNGLGVRCTLQQELGRVGWVCTGGVVMHVAYLLCVGVFFVWVFVSG